MKNFIDAVYRFGNLYDKKTRKRIIIEDGAEVGIAINALHQLEEDPNIKPEKLLSSEGMMAAIEKKKIDKGKYWKVFDAGKVLYFEVSGGVRRRNAKEDESIQCLFQVKLLEDLYIYKKKSTTKNARFFDCHCVVEQCLTDFEFFEPVYAFSLSNSYERTYKLYFSMFGSPTANAFDRFFEDKELKEVIREKTDALWKDNKKE